MPVRLRKILIADPDPPAARALARALRERAYQVSVAADGSRALEVAVLRHPDMVVFDQACKLVEARTFIQILRTNPRTEDIPVLITGTLKDPERVRFLRDGYLRKPYNLDDALGRIAHILRRLDAARDLKAETREIEGSLKQVGLADLLQILSSNRRSGTLSLEAGEEHGEIMVADGRPVNARMGTIEGEKAFFRLLAFKEGSFAFVPGPLTSAARIRRTMEEALLEGLRQSDESAGLLAALPVRPARIKLVPDAGLSSDLHPVTAEVVRLLAEPRSVAELLDLTSSPDFEVLSAAKALMDKGLAEVAPDLETPRAGPLLQPAELHALRGRVLHGRPAAKEAVGKAVLLSDSVKRVRAFVEKLAEVPAYRALREPTAELLGTWARLDFPDGLRVELCSIPGADEARPLWRPFAAGALGAVALDRGSATLRLGEWLLREAKVPLLLAGESEIPPRFKGLPGMLGASRDTPRELMRSLLQGVLQHSS